MIRIFVALIISVVITAVLFILAAMADGMCHCMDSMFNLFLWPCVRLKVIRVDNKFLYVSNYLKEIVIPFSEVADVTENVWTDLHPVTIRLKSRSDFGHKIVFMPTIRFFALFSSHPIVAELRKLARLR